MTIKQYAQRAYQSAVKLFDFLTGRELKKAEQSYQDLSIRIQEELLKAEEAKERSKRTIAESDKVGREYTRLHQLRQIVTH